VVVSSEHYLIAQKVMSEVLHRRDDSQQLTARGTIVTLCNVYDLRIERNWAEWYKNNAKFRWKLSNNLVE